MKKQTEPKFKTREEWLTAATEQLRPIFKSKGHDLPPVRVSVGWPSRGGLAKKKRTIGECWDKKASSEGIAQIFISPWLDGTNTLEILATHVHELIHAVFGCQEKHGKKFGVLARAMGLEGKLTATVPGAECKEYCDAIAEKLGPIPHGKLDQTKSGIKKQGTRMIKCECPKCGYVCRTTAKWLEEAGAPICANPAHKLLPMVFDAPPKDPQDEGE